MQRICKTDTKKQAAHRAARFVTSVTGLSRRQRPSVVTIHARYIERRCECTYKHTHAHQYIYTYIYTYAYARSYIHALIRRHQHLLTLPMNTSYIHDALAHTSVGRIAIYVLFVMLHVHVRINKYYSTFSDSKE